MNSMPLNPKQEDTTNPHPLLFDVLRERIAAKRFSLRTEKAYLLWAERLLRFHPNRHPVELGAKEIEAFVAHLDNTIGFSPSTQQQAFAALSFLYREVLGTELPWVDALARPKKAPRVPVYLTPDEVEAVVANLEERHRLPVRLLHGTGMRLMECTRLRIKDLDFEAAEISLHDGKGNLDRIVPLSLSLAPALREQVDLAHALWLEDRRKNLPGVLLPQASPHQKPLLSTDWEWYWVFPSRQPSTGTRDAPPHRPPRHEQALQRAIHRALAQAGIAKYASTNTLRHSFAMDYLRAGYDIRSLQQRLGHADLYSTQLYTSLLEAEGKPAD